VTVGSSAPEERQIAPSVAWAELEAGTSRLLDLRSRAERATFGYPAGSKKVSLVVHAVRPDRSAIYLCQHAVRSKLPWRRGAREVAGGFKAWTEAGVPAVPGARTSDRRPRSED
jgi:rhodanese-related sulfurtransferase